MIQDRHYAEVRPWIGSSEQDSPRRQVASRCYGNGSGHTNAKAAQAKEQLNAGGILMDGNRLGRDMSARHAHKVPRGPKQSLHHLTIQSWKAQPPRRSSAMLIIFPNLEIASLCLTSFEVPELAFGQFPSSACQAGRQSCRAIESPTGTAHVTKVKPDTNRKRRTSLRNLTSSIRLNS